MPLALSASTIKVVTASSILRSPYRNCCKGDSSQPLTANLLATPRPRILATPRSAIDASIALRSSASCEMCFCPDWCGGSATTTEPVCQRSEPAHRRSKLGTPWPARLQITAVLQPWAPGADGLQRRSKPVRQLSGGRARWGRGGRDLATDKKVVLALQVNPDHQG
jgi:hypothetical protein